jgi:hypothetical protein
MEHTRLTNTPMTRRFEAGDEVVFTDDARKVRNWGNAGKRPRPDRLVRKVSHYTGVALDLVLDDGSLWNECWLEAAPSTVAKAAARESIARGLAESAAGDTVDLGDFTQFADDEDAAADAPLVLSEHPDARTVVGTAVFDTYGQLDSQRTKAIADLVVSALEVSGHLAAAPVRKFNIGDTVAYTDNEYLRIEHFRVVAYRDAMTATVILHDGQQTDEKNLELITATRS